jgi:hypothetical protein
MNFVKKFRQTIAGPFFVLTSTGSISSLNQPSLLALAQVCWDLEGSIKGR